jgi:transposase
MQSNESRKHQRALKQALTITTMLVDENEASVADLVRKYGVTPQMTRKAMRLAFGKKYVKVSRTASDGSEVFTFTNKGWQLVLLRWIARHGVATEEYLTERFGFQEDQQLVTRFVDWGIGEGLLRTGGTMRTEPELVIATKTGINAVGVARLGVCPVADRAESHLRTTVMIAIRLELEHRYTHTVLSEREIFVLQRGKLQGPITREEGAGGAIAMAVYESDPETGELSRKRGDLLMRPRRAEGEWVVAEIELTPPTKAGELVSQCIGWRDCESVGQVIYYTAPAVTAGMERAIDKALEGIIPRAGLEVIEAGSYERNEPGNEPARKISLVELPAKYVPSVRRKRDYQLPPIPCAAQYYRALGESSPNLTSELLEIVEWVGWHGFTPVDAIATRFGLSEGDACHLLVMAHGAGWLDFTTMLREEGALFRISRAGRKRLNKSMPAPWEVLYSLVTREAAHSRVAAMLELEYTDREARGSVETRTDCLIGGEALLAVAPTGTPIGTRRRPDNLLSTRGASDAMPHAVIVELLRIKADVAEEVIRAYSESDEVDLVHYYATHEEVLGAAKRAVRLLGLEKRFLVRPLPLSKQAQARLSRTRDAPVASQSWKRSKVLGDCLGKSHQPRKAVAGWPCREIGEATWEELLERFPDMACEHKGHKWVCARSSVNGILCVLENKQAWNKLPAELGYGSGTRCAKRLYEFRRSGAWKCLREISQRREPERRVDWDTPVQRTRAGQRCVSHEPREEVQGWPVREIGDEVWEELCREFPDLACENRRRRGICVRSAVDGILCVLGSDRRFDELPAELGYGSAAICIERLYELRKRGIWMRLREIVERREPDRTVDWDRAAQGKEAGKRCESHAPRLAESTFNAISDEVWKEVLAEFPDLACIRRGKRLCARLAVNGILYVLENEQGWSKLPAEMGYGSGQTCEKRLAKLRAQGVWELLRETVERREPNRRVDWARAEPRS